MLRCASLISANSRYTLVREFDSKLLGSTSQWHLYPKSRMIKIILSTILCATFYMFYPFFSSFMLPLTHSYIRLD